MNKDFHKKLNEVFDHLWSGRNRLALPIAEKLYNEFPDEPEVVLSYAWALFENGEHIKAMDYAVTVEEPQYPSIRLNLIQGYLMMRMSLFEGAVENFDRAKELLKRYLIWAYEIKAKSLAGINKFQEALEDFSLAVTLMDKVEPSHYQRLQFYKTAVALDLGKEKITADNIDKYLEDCKKAIDKKEYWFALYVSRKILLAKPLSEYHEEAAFIEIESMYFMNQLKPAYEKALELRKKNPRDKKLRQLIKTLERVLEQEKLARTETSVDVKKDKLSAENKSPKVEYKFFSRYYPHEKADVYKLMIFEDTKKFQKGIGPYLSHINIEKIKNPKVEVIFANPYFRIEDTKLDAKLVWYVNDVQIYSDAFEVIVSKDFDTVLFTEPIKHIAKFPRAGQGKVELYFDNFKVAETYFVIGQEKKEITDEPLPQNEPQSAPENNMPGKELSSTKDDVKNKIPQEEEKSLEELLDEINELVGLENIKKAIKNLIDFIEFNKKRKKLGLKSQDVINLHVIFEGNPGTGKTTVARMLGKILKAMGLLEKGHVVEVDRAALVGEYIGQTAQKTDKAIKDALGGILFIDEAYTLYKKGDSKDFGREAIDILLKRMEDYKGKFVVIAAGYPDEMEEFLTANPGLKSRFTNIFLFEDYTPDELLEIFKRLLKKEEYEITDDALEFLKKKFTELYRSRDKNFGNAREVGKIFLQAKVKLGKRLLAESQEGKEHLKEDFVTITLDDIKAAFEEEKGKEVQIGIDEELLQEALDELNNLVGIKKVKEDVQKLIKFARFNLKSGGDSKDKFVNHILFFGNPGTGKTTVARIVAKIYKALGILPRGQLVETDRDGLVSGYVGQTTEKTNKIIDKALGGVLFIDEAYTLVKKGDLNDFGQEALATLLKRMEDDRGKFIVIAAGYTDEMQDFLDANPGLRSRFTETYEFEDYTPDELLEILTRMLAAKNLTLTDSAKKKVKMYFLELYRNRDKNFGNARIARNISDKIQRRHLLKLADMPDEEREKIDVNLIDDSLIDELLVEKKEKEVFLEGNEEKLQEYLTELNNLVGLENVKQEVQRLIKSLKISKLRKERGLKVVEKSLHSVFSGNPGTGKTTVARLLSKIFKELGILERGHLVECDRSDLVAGYQGQTALKTDKVIKKALGGTLFIDEAYTLSRGGNDFGQEAIDTLLKRMEDYRGKFVVIVAGYTQEMENFLNSNPGLSSRFTNKFHFDDYAPRQLLEIAYNIANENGYEFDEGALQLLLDLFEALYERRDKNFGNARLVRNILFKIISYQEDRIASSLDLSDADLTLLKFEDVIKLFDEYGVQPPVYEN